LPEIEAGSHEAGARRPPPLVIFLTIVLAGSVSAADWQPLGPFGGSVQSIAADPRHAGTLLAGGRNGLLFRSDDDAKTWRRVPFGRPLSGSIQTLAIDPSNSAHYLVGISGEDASSAGLWESSDGGAHWQQSLAGLAVESLALWPKDPAVVAVGTRHGVYRLSEGTAWKRISSVQNPELQDVTALAFDPADSETLYAGTPHLPWKTTDGGTSWHSIRSGMIDDSDVFSIAIDPAHPERLFASACSGIYRSDSAGAAWKLLNGVPRTSRRTHIIAPDPTQPQVLYAGTTSGLLKSVNGGAVWRQLNSLPINSIAFSAADSQTLFLATESSGVLVTRDGGVTVAPTNEGLLTHNVGDLIVSGPRAWMSTVYEGAQGGIFRFEPEFGWKQVASPRALGGDNVVALASEPTGKLVYAATVNRVYRSSDEKWELVPTVGLTGIRALAFTSEGTLLAGTSRGLFSLNDAAWKPADVAGHTRLPVQAIYSSPGMVAIRTEFGTYFSPDGGQSWKEWPMPSSAGQVSEIALCGSSALAATSHSLLRFSPAGSTSLSVHGIPEGTVSAVTFDPTNCLTAYAAQFGMLYVSQDAGSNWAVLGGIGTGVIEALRVVPSAPHRLLAAFRNEGIFALDLSLH
jgi:photosystem II stability/assembly factor-like uncharacterized protein